MKGEKKQRKKLWAASEAYLQQQKLSRKMRSTGILSLNKNNKLPANKSTTMQFRKIANIKEDIITL